MEKLCECGCGKLISKFNSKGCEKRYIAGHQWLVKVKNFILPLVQICKECKQEKQIDEYGVRNYKTHTGFIYQRPRSKCKICECKLTHNTWQINPDIRNRRKEQKRNDKSLKSLIQNRIATWKKKTPGSDLTTEFLLQQYESQNGKCYYTGESLEVLKIDEWKNNFRNSISLDRLDPKKGYTIDNVVFCLYFVNTMKGNLTEQEFYDKMKQILQTHNQI